MTNDEGFRLIDQIAEVRTPILVFSGGDPMKRPELPEWIRYAKSQKLRTATIPAVVPSLNRQKIEELKKCGLYQIAFSLDAAHAEAHDGFRRKEGVFQRTLEFVHIARDLGLAVQINSLINVHNETDLDSLIRLVEGLGIVFWEVFFLVPVGRGKELTMMSGLYYERAFRKLYDLSKRVDFVIKVTEAPHYKRFCIEQELKQKGLDL